MSKDSYSTTPDLLCLRIYMTELLKGYIFLQPNFETENEVIKNL